jgi:hypothetical protein
VLFADEASNLGHTTARVNGTGPIPPSLIFLLESQVDNGAALKVFVSWSKNSRGVGKAVSDAVREIFDPVVETFISQEILAGSRGLDTIDGELNDTDFGIICLTRANQTEQWINYEAGALSRQVADKRTRMGVFLIDLPGAEEVNSPMDIFQCKLATLEGFTDLMVSLNKLGPELKESTLDKRIGAAWPDVHKAVEAVAKGEPTPVAKPPKSRDEKMDEVLGLVKAMEASLGEVRMMGSRSVETSMMVAEVVGRAPTRWSPIRTKSSERSGVIRTLAGDEIVISRPELDPLLNDILEEIRSSSPRFSRASIGLSGEMIVFRTNGALPQKLKQRVMMKLDPFYPPERIHFKDDSSADDETEDLI